MNDLPISLKQLINLLAEEFVKDGSGSDFIKGEIIKRLRMDQGALWAAEEHVKRGTYKGETWYDEFLECVETVEKEFVEESIK